MLSLAELLSILPRDHVPSIHYLQVEWLEVLHNASVDCSLIWGMLDPVAVPAVADYVWANYLKSRPHANAAYHKLDGTNLEHRGDRAGSDRAPTRLVILELLRQAALRHVPDMVPLACSQAPTTTCSTTTRRTSRPSW